MDIRSFLLILGGLGEEKERLCWLINDLTSDLGIADLFIHRASKQ